MPPRLRSRTSTTSSSGSTPAKSTRKRNAADVQAEDTPLLQPDPGCKVQRLSSRVKMSVQSTSRPKLLSTSRTKPRPKKTPGQPHAGQSAATAAPIANDPQNMKAVLVSDLNVRTNSDTSECRITGSALLPGNKLILADHTNKKIKLLNLQTSQVTSELLTFSDPWDITSITSEQVAVTLPGSGHIVFMKVTDTIQIDREMPVAGYCSAILHSNGKLIVTCARPEQIEIMTLDGTVERKTEQTDLFKWISHIALSLDCQTIYLADFTGGCVKRISLEGVVEAEYSDDELLCPSGLPVDQYGRVLVCGVHSHNIHLLTPDLTKVKVLVDKLDYPCSSLSNCHDTGRLYVGMHSDNVKVYQLS